jgi:hypothetical protein
MRGDAQGTVDVVDGDHEVVIVDLRGWNLAGDDAAEEAAGVGHGRLLLQKLGLLIMSQPMSPMAPAMR